MILSGLCCFPSQLGFLVLASLSGRPLSVSEVTARLTGASSLGPGKGGRGQEAALSQESESQGCFSLGELGSPAHCWTNHGPGGSGLLSLILQLWRWAEQLHWGAGSSDSTRRPRF